MFFDTSVLVPAVADQLANHEAAFEEFLNHTYSVRDFERCRARGIVVTAP